LTDQACSRGKALGCLYGVSGRISPAVFVVHLLFVVVFSRGHQPQNLLVDLWGRCLFGRIGRSTAGLSREPGLLLCRTFVGLFRPLWFKTFVKNACSSPCGAWSVLFSRALSRGSILGVGLSGGGIGLVGFSAPAASLFHKQLRSFSRELPRTYWERERGTLAEGVQTRSTIARTSSPAGRKIHLCFLRHRCV
jgi:hypothetical protein